MCQYGDPEPGRGRQRLRPAYRYAECHRELVMDTSTQRKGQKKRSHHQQSVAAYIRGQPRRKSARTGRSSANRRSWWAACNTALIRTSTSRACLCFFQASAATVQTRGCGLQVGHYKPHIRRTRRARYDRLTMRAQILRGCRRINCEACCSSESEGQERERGLQMGETNSALSALTVCTLQSKAPPRSPDTSTTAGIPEQSITFCFCSLVQRNPWCSPGRNLDKVREQSATLAQHQSAERRF